MTPAQPSSCVLTQVGPYTKIRQTLPSSLTRNAGLLEDARRHVRQLLADERCTFKEVRITRSKPVAIKVTAPTGLAARPQQLVTRAGNCLGFLIDELGLPPETAVVVWRKLLPQQARALHRLATGAPSLQGDLDPLLALASDLMEAGDQGAATHVIGRLPWTEAMEALDHLQTTLQLPPWVAMRLLCTHDMKYLLSLLPWQRTADRSPARVMLMRLQRSLVNADEGAAAAALLLLLQGDELPG